jgi:hypothetical protein
VHISIMYGYRRFAHRDDWLSGFGPSVVGYNRSV